MNQPTYPFEKTSFMDGPIAKFFQSNTTPKITRILVTVLYYQWLVFFFTASMICSFLFIYSFLIIQMPLYLRLELIILTPCTFQKRRLYILCFQQYSQIDYFMIQVLAKVICIMIYPKYYLLWQLQLIVDVQFIQIQTAHFRAKMDNFLTFQFTVYIIYRENNDSSAHDITQNHPTKQDSLGKLQ